MPVFLLVFRVPSCGMLGSYLAWGSLWNPMENRVVSSIGLRVNVSLIWKYTPFY